MVLRQEEAGRTADAIPPRRGSASPLRVLSSVAGLYGVGLGLFALPAGLFIGPEIAFGAVAHLLLRLMLLAPGRAMDRGSLRAAQFVRLPAVLIAAICGTGVVECPD